jgi:hypothetical protein
MLSYLRQATSRIYLEILKKNMEIFSQNSKFHTQISKLAALYVQSNHTVSNKASVHRLCSGQY